MDIKNIDQIKSLWISRCENGWTLDISGTSNGTRENNKGEKVKAHLYSSKKIVLENKDEISLMKNVQDLIDAQKPLEPIEE